MQLNHANDRFLLDIGDSKFSKLLHHGHELLLTFVAMAAGMPYFFLIWVLGFAVVLPIAGILFPEDDADSELAEDERGADVSTNPLTSLRDQYARDDLTDEAFKRKLDRLLETELPKNAAEWRELAKEKAR